MSKKYKQHGYAERLKYMHMLENAMMENFFGLMKSELLYLQEWDSVEQFAKELVKYIRYYNNDRIKLSLNGKSPVQYRALFQSKSAS